MQQQSSNKVVDGQELLRVLRNSLPLFHLLIRPPWPHELRNRLLLLFGGLVVFVVCSGCLVFFCAATCIVTLSSLEQGDLCRTCTHSASTRAKKEELEGFMDVLLQWVTD